MQSAASTPFSPRDRRCGCKGRRSRACPPQGDQDPPHPDHVGLVAAKDIVDKRKDAILAKLDKHTTDVVKPYERRINEHLAAFNAGFTITETKHSYPGGIATSSYQLVINNIAVDVGDGKTPTDTPSFKNTLSGGDRTTSPWLFSLPIWSGTRNWRAKLSSSTTP